MRLANPQALLLLLLVPLLFFLSRRGQRPSVLSYPSIDALAVLPPSLLTRLYRALPVLRVLVLILCILALAQPQWRVETVQIHREGIAIDMVVDVSRSMAALDLQVDGQQRNRLEVVKQAFWKRQPPSRNTTNNTSRGSLCSCCSPSDCYCWKWCWQIPACAPSLRSALSVFACREPATLYFWH